MRSNELRIGNWVQCAIIKIGSLKKGGFHQVEIDDFNYNLEDYFRPIPLTEEWLVKFGFDKIYSLDDSYGPSLMDKIGKYEDSEFFEYVVSSEDDSHGGWGYYTKDVKYVHQLQNLYFALTSEELTIKE